MRNIFIVFLLVLFSKSYSVEPGDLSQEELRLFIATLNLSQCIYSKHDFTGVATRLSKDESVRRIDDTKDGKVRYFDPKVGSIVSLGKNECKLEIYSSSLKKYISGLPSALLVAGGDLELSENNSQHNGKLKYENELFSINIHQDQYGKQPVIVTSILRQ